MSEGREVVVIVLRALGEAGDTAPWRAPPIGTRAPRCWVRDSVIPGVCPFTGNFLLLSKAFPHILLMESLHSSERLKSHHHSLMLSRGLQPLLSESLWRARSST